MAATTINAILGAGRLYFDDGTGERYIAQTSNLTQLEEHETIERLGSVDGPRRVVDQRSAEVRRQLTFGTVDINAENLGLFFGGAAPVLIDQGTAFTAPDTAAGLHYQVTTIPGAFMLNSIVFANEGAPVEGTHYSVDLTKGRVEVLQDGLGQLDITYTATNLQILPLACATVRGALRFIADPTTGTGVDAYWPDVALTPSEPIDWKSRQDFTRLGWTAEILGECCAPTETGAAQALGAGVSYLSGPVIDPAADDAPPDIPAAFAEFWETRNGDLGALAHGATVASWPAAVGVLALTPVSASHPRYVAADATANGQPSLLIDGVNGSRAIETALGAPIPQPWCRVLLATFVGAWSTEAAAEDEYLMSDPGPGGDALISERSAALNARGSVHLFDAGAQDTTLQLPASRQVILFEVRNGAGSYVRIVDAAGADVQSPATPGASASLVEDRIGAETTNNGVTASKLYMQAHGIIDHAPSVAEIDEIVAFFDYHYRQPHVPGAFPTFGATDYVELDASDLTEGDGAPIVSNWVDRQNGYIFAPTGSPLMDVDGSPQGGRAVYFDGSGGDYFQNNAITWAQPGTVIVELKEDPRASALIARGWVDGVGAGNRWHLFRDTGAPFYRIFAGVVLLPTAPELNSRPGNFGWRHYAGLFDGANSELYVDGQYGQTGDAGAHTITGLRIGDNYLGTAGAHGWIAWVGAWDVKLTPAQIRDVLRYRGLI